MLHGVSPSAELLRSLHSTSRHFGYRDGLSRAGRLARLVLEQFERTSGVRLTIEDADDHVIRISDIESRPEAGLDEDDAIEPSEDRYGRNVRDALHSSANGQDEPLLIVEGPHLL